MVLKEQSAPSEPADSRYNTLQEHILGRDQVAASELLYDLIRDERPLTEMISETVRIHAPYTNVPYHQRIDNGFVRFVNNDHCLLSARASLRMPGHLPDPVKYLPMAQTMWYVPTGLDPWNQLIGKMPGHYGRRVYQGDPNNPPPPEVHWPDVPEPIYLEGSLDERLNQWLTLVEHGEVMKQYQVFLGLMKDEEHRKEALAQLVFAGLIDVQDRQLYNRSYTTGHKAYRARATIELGEAVGWENAHHILYAGVPDMAVGPRWYSTYEAACQVSLMRLENEIPGSSLDPTPGAMRDRELMANTTPPTKAETHALIDAILHQDEPAFIDLMVEMLLEGKGPRQILDVIQVAAAQVVLDTGDMRNYAMSQHGYEYCNTLAWFFDTFDHPHAVKLLFVAASFINRASHHQRVTPGNMEAVVRAPRGADGLSAHRILKNLDDSMTALDPQESVAWTQAYLESGEDREPLMETLAVGAAKMGNDPHNQEIALCMIDDFRLNRAEGRERLLLACAQHTAGHVKYGEAAEPFRRFAQAFGIPSSGRITGDAEPEEAVLDQMEPA